MLNLQARVNVLGLLCYLFPFGTTLAFASGEEAERVQKEPPPNSEKLSFVFAGLRSTHEQLRSGLFEAVDKTFRAPADDENEQPSNEPIAESQIVCGFDRLNGRLRYDETAVRGMNPGGGVRYIFEGDHCHYRQLNAIEVNVFPKDAVPTFSVRPFDVRQVGLGNVNDFQERVGFEQLCNGFLNTLTFTQELKNDDGTIDLHFVAPKAPVTVLLRVDPAKGYLPVHLEAAHKRTKQAFATTTTDWKHRNGAYVPVSMNCQYRQPDEVIRKALTFTWKNVNEPVDEKFLSKNAMDIKKGDLLVDFTVDKDKPVIHDPNEIGGADVRETMRETNGQPSQSRLVWLLACNGVGIVIVGGFILWRRRVNQAKTLPK